MANQDFDHLGWERLSFRACSGGCKLQHEKPRFFEDSNHGFPTIY
jgi:hypothetical protein